MAPEGFSGYITYKSDIYSLVVILKEILTGQRGFLDGHVRTVSYK
jgi:serine/threonine protein kinase